MLKIDKYEFEDHPIYDVKLYAVVISPDINELSDRIVGRYERSDGLIVPFTVDINGRAQLSGADVITLTPLDKFKEFKKAFPEGAIIHHRTDSATVTKLDDFDGNNVDDFYIKGHIFIEKWNKHKEIIKQWWNGAKIEYYSDTIEGWDSVWCDIGWFVEDEYRVKEIITEMSIKELEEKYGINNLKIIKD